MYQELLINSIYKATEGEGVFIGTPQIFIRLQGCSIGCINCDSKDTWSFDQDMGRSLESILTKVTILGLKRVSITGGDPLHPKHIPALEVLCQKLKERKYFINIEASGARLVHSIFDLVNFISFDVKTPSTGVKCDPVLLEKLQVQYPGKFQVKSVIQNAEDFEFVSQIHRKHVQAPIDWCLTPCYEPGENFPAERFQKIVEWNQNSGGHFRVIGQQHKWIFGPDKKQV